MIFIFFFFFKQKTAYEMRISDWSSDVCSSDLLDGHAAEIAQAIGVDAEIVEFGAGATRKVRFLLDALDRPRGYLPIDISGEHLEDSAARLRADYPGLPVTVVAGDYTAGLDLPAPPKGTRRRAGFFPGSTIGNFTPAEAPGFLEADRQST